MTPQLRYMYTDRKIQEFLLYLCQIFDAMYVFIIAFDFLFTRISCILYMLRSLSDLRNSLTTYLVKPVTFRGA